MKVRALRTFADSDSSTGLRYVGAIFEIEENNFEKLNSIHDFPLVEKVDTKTVKTPKEKRESKNNLEAVADKE